MVGESCEYLRENGDDGRFFGVKRDIGSPDLNFDDTIDLVVLKVEVVDDFIVVVEVFVEVLSGLVVPKGNTGIVHSVVMSLLLETSVIVTSSSSWAKLTSGLSWLGITPNFGMVSFQASG